MLLTIALSNGALLWYFHHHTQEYIGSVRRRRYRPPPPQRLASDAPAQRRRTPTPSRARPLGGAAQVRWLFGVWLVWRKPLSEGKGKVS